MLCKGQTQSLQFVHCLIMERWRIVAVSGGLENTPLGRVHSDSDGAARSTPLTQNKNVCQHQAYAKRCILHALRHKTHSLIIVGSSSWNSNGPNESKRCCCICQSVQVWLQTIGTSSGPRFGENRSHLEKSGLLGV